MQRLAGKIEDRLGEAALRIYGAAGRLGEPLVDRLLERRRKRGKEDSLRLGERLGIAGRERPQGPLVWVHAASVGETNAVLPLVSRLVERDLAVLLTTGTVTSAEVAARRLPELALHQFAPVDTPGALRRFLDHWRPGLALFAESELWPGSLTALAEASVPLVLVNARLSPRSFRGWNRARPLARALLRRTQACLAQTVADARRFEALGAADVRVCGNLKFDAPPLPVDPDELARLRRAAANRPVLLAASTHPGEETAMIDVHRALAVERPDLLTIIVPRHPERGAEIAAALASAGLDHGRRGEAGDLAGKSVYVADTIGELGLWYSLADVAVLGGSFVPHGGQNPIEPARLGVPILSGEHVTNFRDVYDALHEARAVRTLATGDLAAAIGELLGDPAERQRMSREAHACVDRFTGAVERTLEALAPALAALDGRSPCRA